jgi:flagellar hook-length control protein FliK
MQIQPIPPLGPLVVGAKETQTNSGENFLDSLQSAHSKSDTNSGEQPDRIATAQPDDEYAAAPAPITDETTAPPEQSAKESDDHIESAAIVEPASANDEKLDIAGKMPASGLAAPAATQIETPADIEASSSIPQLVVGTPHHYKENGLQQPAGYLPAAANNFVPQQSAVAMQEAAQHIVPQQNSETEYPPPSTTQSDGATSPADSRFAEVPGLTPAPDPETVQRFVQQRQRSWGPGFDANAADPAGQKTGARMAPVKISDQFMNEFSTNSSGQDVLWANPAEGITTTYPTQGSGESAAVFHSMASSQSTTPTAVLPQDGTVAKPHAGFGNIVENRIIDQVIEQISIRSSQQQSSVTIKLHPEELGHLKLELVSYNETIKAHIHVQNQQIQDIVEKNLTRLREGFEQQGLVLDEIQVSVDSESRSEPGLFNDQHALHAGPQTANSTGTQESDDIISKEAMIIPHRSDSIISLRI